MDKLIENKHTIPFLRWTGSKRWFTKTYLTDFMPEEFGDYHEPFLGAGAVYFHLANQFSEERQFFLSDSNEDLINVYVQIRDNPVEVISELKRFKNTEEDYYHIRSLSFESLVERAARFIYLNRTSFNGIYRVNSRGIYNVPYGKRPKVDFVTQELLTKVSEKLQNAHINTQGFEESLSNIKCGDLVFLDPPYTVAHENNGFIEYNQQLFAWEDQERLRAFVEKINELGAYFILTNASHFSIANLYEGVGSIRKLSRNSQVGGRNKTRRMYNELIISNIKI
ncbi:DNA adenine methylase [Pedobacter sandarakinus]|uniref:DNA adenine methylase n=1 Tax=Pedobacter sandarakinus TaxID=353156 RepID=UPI002246BF52|nr:Dam family site-specific DNA-(adenine-N6)-methyltransferase [Pedobacter sandarakinus]MCX2575705.1 Dam family site-specific DNA-(adenine-N6)-methyltransferase [Pedobacter sandarakinus]